MKMKKIIICFLFSLTLVIAGYFYLFSNKVLEQSISPNHKWKVNIKSPKFMILLLDLHYYIFLDNLETNEEKRIWESPDENENKEFRIIWSKDGNKFLVLGKNLILSNKELLYPTGEQIYFLFDIPSGEKWCNCTHTYEKKITSEIIKSEFGFEESK